MESFGGRHSDLKFLSRILLSSFGVEERSYSNQHIGMANVLGHPALQVPSTRGMEVQQECWPAPDWPNSTAQSWAEEPAAWASGTLLFLGHQGCLTVKRLLERPRAQPGKSKKILKTKCNDQRGNGRIPQIATTSSISSDLLTM